MSFAIYPSLKGAVAFVTGGASGIGEEIVRAFAGQGSQVGFIDIDAGRGRALADELAGGGATIHFEAADLRDRHDPAARLVIAVPAGDVAGAWAKILPRLSVAGLGAAATGQRARAGWQSASPRSESVGSTPATSLAVWPAAE